MKLVPVCCQNCGASLEIGESTRFVTCTYCLSRLTIQHTGAAIFTELLGEIAQKTDRIASEMASLRIQTKIQQLERDWLLEREGMLNRSKDGTTSEPDELAAWITGLAIFLGAILFGITVVNAKGGDANVAAVGAAILTIASVITIVYGTVKAREFEKAKDAYLQRRRDLEQDLTVPL